MSAWPTSPKRLPGWRLWCLPRQFRSAFNYCWQEVGSEPSVSIYNSIPLSWSHAQWEEFIPFLFIAMFLNILFSYPSPASSHQTKQCQCLQQASGSCFYIPSVQSAVFEKLLGISFCWCFTVTLEKYKSIPNKRPICATQDEVCFCKSI